MSCFIVRYVVLGTTITIEGGITMRIHYLQHVPFETPEYISDWAKERGYMLTGSLTYDNHRFPELSEFDMLVIMGGPMGVYDEEKYPWLAREKQFIKKSIQQRKLVLGICLGAQFIAEAIGGRVYKNEHKEIGWFPIQLTNWSKHSELFKVLPKDFTAFHWHGDTFELPPAAMRIAFSKGCANQAFEYDDHVVGLQFHLESSNASIRRLVDHCPDDLEPGIYVQKPNEMLDQDEYLAQSNAILFTLLDAMVSKHGAPGDDQPQIPLYCSEQQESYRIVGD